MEVMDTGGKNLLTARKERPLLTWHWLPAKFCNNYWKLSMKLQNLLDTVKTNAVI